VDADLVVKGGTVVDGSGAPAFEADVVIQDDRIVAVGRHEGRAGEVIDARGKIVTPGFVDVHTHLDAQLTWDPLGAPACWHGITSVVVGNCGVGFAPCRPADRDYLMFLMEGVEDIPVAAMKAGMRWTWSSFGEYLAALAAGGLGPNVGAYVAHAPLRVFAMGERGAVDTPPTDAELAIMQAAVDDALSAGALGISTGRTTMHRTPAGDPVPGTFADAREILALASPLGRRQRGVFQLVPFGAAGEAADGFARDRAARERPPHAGPPVPRHVARFARTDRARLGGWDSLGAAGGTPVDRSRPRLRRAAVAAALVPGGRRLARQTHDRAAGAPR
jgi:N-acyl-D-aspartate/D-glutamate deacylase